MLTHAAADLLISRRSRLPSTLRSTQVLTLLALLASLEQSTRFTSTKVGAVCPSTVRSTPDAQFACFACFTSTRVQILTQKLVPSGLLTLLALLALLLLALLALLKQVKQLILNQVKQVKPSGLPHTSLLKQRS